MAWFRSPELVEEVASGETSESLVVHYLLLSYFIPDRDAQILEQLARGELRGLAMHEVERQKAIWSGIMYDRGEREAALKRLGYATSSE